MTRAPGWRPRALPDLGGRTAVVTGANSGLGLETSVALARAGAHVVMTARDGSRGERALAELRRRVPEGSAECRGLDLADLASVRGFVQGLEATHPRLHLLVNNAGVMATPRRRTADGFELQLGTNHLGHFALTGLLLPHLRAAEGDVADPGARVVTVSSVAHHAGRIDRRNLLWDKGYRRWPAYGRSKLANLLFAYELARRLVVAGSSVASLAAHPGIAATNLGQGMVMGLPSALGRVVRGGYALISQGPEAGSWPLLRAATDPAAMSGQYYGPSGPPGEARGDAVLVGSSGRSHSMDDARWLWERSEDLTGVRFDLPVPR